MVKCEAMEENVCAGKCGEERTNNDEAPKTEDVTAKEKKETQKNRKKT